MQNIVDFIKQKFEDFKEALSASRDYFDNFRRHTWEKLSDGISSLIGRIRKRFFNKDDDALNMSPLFKNALILQLLSPDNANTSGIFKDLFTELANQVSTVTSSLARPFTQSAAIPLSMNFTMLGTLTLAETADEKVIEKFQEIEQEVKNVTSDDWHGPARTPALQTLREKSATCIGLRADELLVPIFADAGLQLDLENQCVKKSNSLVATFKETACMGNQMSAPLWTPKVHTPAAQPV